MVPSSASDTAPSSAYSPPAIHTARYSPVVGSCAATCPGVRKIPAPMVFPTMTASPNVTPSTRSRPGRSSSRRNFWRAKMSVDQGRARDSSSPSSTPRNST